MSQAHGHKQEQKEHDNVRGKVYNFSDLKHEKSDKRPEQVQKDKPNAQHSAARQTAQQRAAQSAEETAKQSNSRSHSGSDRDRSRVKKVLIPDSGEAIPNEHAPADK